MPIALLLKAMYHDSQGHTPTIQAFYGLSYKQQCVDVLLSSLENFIEIGVIFNDLNLEKFK